MQILLNNRAEIIDADSMTVRQLLDFKTFTFKMLIVKINGKFIKKGEYQTAVVKDGDDVMVLHMISGG